MRWRGLLWLWVLAVLFPTAWLARQWPAARLWFDRVFSPEWMHWVSHALLFAAIALLWLLPRRSPPDRAGCWQALGLVFAAGVLQEGFQWLSGAAAIHWNSALDLLIDLGGGLLGIALAKAVFSLRRR